MIIEREEMRQLDQPATAPVTPQFEVELGEYPYGLPEATVRQLSPEGMIFLSTLAVRGSEATPSVETKAAPPKPSIASMLIETVKNGQERRKIGANLLAQGYIVKEELRPKLSPEGLEKLEQEIAQVLAVDSEAVKLRRHLS
jgi:hypothetical protein